jgi:NAD(P)-dependent dehydrogenase (short-subunit alcohol dehydrogenase family)
MTLITIPFAARATAAEVLRGGGLTGRHMIVAGGASGLGAEPVRALAGAGAHVTIATRDPAIAKPIVDEFPETDIAALDLADLGRYVPSTPSGTAPSTRSSPTQAS